MSLFHQKVFIIFVALASTTHIAIAQLNDSILQTYRTNSMLVKNRSLVIYDVRVIQTIDWTALPRIPKHPTFDSLLTPEKEFAILTEINSRRRALNTDTLLSSGYFYVWKPYFDWLAHEDPHCRIEMAPAKDKNTYKDSNQFNNAVGSRRLPFTLLQINDTVIIERSYDPIFKKGDMILSINGVSMLDYLKYSYRDRYTSPLTLMRNYYFNFAVDKFNIHLIRNDKEINVETEGMPTKELTSHLQKEEYNITQYTDEKCGYIQIRRFYPYNDRLIKIVRNAIIGFKKNGITNVIIDIRRNPGGSGRSFDKLLSIFINKPTVSYLKSEKIRVSQETLGDYDFLTSDMIGKTVSVPDKYIVKEFVTSSSMYVDGMTYYVLISRNTGSIAASFANILQYNNAAKLVGEPLLHNALKYGEVLPGDQILPTLLNYAAISTKEIEEHTNALNGILTPNINIPYVAKDYITAEDAMVEKLLDLIKKSE